MHTSWLKMQGSADAPPIHYQARGVEHCSGQHHWHGKRAHVCLPPAVVALRITLLALPPQAHNHRSARDRNRRGRRGQCCYESNYARLCRADHVRGQKHGWKMPAVL